LPHTRRNGTRSDARKRADDAHTPLDPTREPLLEHCAGKIVATIDTRSSCLVIYPLPEWERIERDLQALPALKPEIKRFQRLILGYATDFELDANGRILLPQSLREYARLDKKLVLVGLGNKMELWSEDLWLGEREQALLESATAEVPEELKDLVV